MDDDSGFDLNLKFCIIGPANVGKTCIRLRAFDNIFQGDYLCTIGPEYVEKVREFPTHNKVIKIALWDGPGSIQRTSESKKNAVIRGCHSQTELISAGSYDGAFVVFDVTSRESFEQDLRVRAKSALIILIGNKADSALREVQEDEGATLASNLGCKVYLETSALTGVGVAE
eukprot:gene13301-28167_t